MKLPRDLFSLYTEKLLSKLFAAMERLQDMIKSFPGDGSQDVSNWIKKVQLVARLKNIDDVASLIPLYLEGAAFAVYDQLPDDRKKDANQVEKELVAAFAQNPFSAYDTFRQRSWCPGEAVDVFLADLRRLAGLAGVQSQELIRCAFVCGLPADVSGQLRAAAQIRESNLDVIVEQARVLMTERVHGGAMAAMKTQDHVVCRDSQGERGRAMVGRKDSGQGWRRKMECFECGGDHPVKFCKNRRPVVCWKCGETGHTSRHCVSGNAPGESPAQTVPRNH